jgi:hypothetical protein
MSEYEINDNINGSLINEMKLDMSSNHINNEKTIPFWTENPNVLFHPSFLFEFFPVSTMTYEQKLNAVSRLVIILTIVLFVITKSIRLLVVSSITLLAIHLLHNTQTAEKNKKNDKRMDLENFEGPAKDYLDQEKIQIPAEVFDTARSDNPFSNVLMTDYDYNVNKKPAPPSYNDNVNKTILEQAKQLVKNVNPDQPDIADKLFKDLGEQFVFEQSLRPFNSNPNTTIPNDQAGFADFCYGSMVSCKEGNLFACARNLSRHTNY